MARKISGTQTVVRRERITAPPFRNVVVEKNYGRVVRSVSVIPETPNVRRRARCDFLVREGKRLTHKRIAHA